MNIALLLIVSVTQFTSLARAGETNTAAPAKIGAAEAGKYYDQHMVVTGKVAQVTLRPTIVFINLDQPFPNSPFAAVIHSENTNQFGDLKALQGKAVEIEGTIKKYHDKPEIELDGADQLKVLGAPAATNAPAAK
ncbi:MAG TPA: hypothetical protein VMB80_11875 [Candidatus Acidoferrum sp.]|nr:hypothetical protein [Candidatus Acidoferrum sp.]